MSVDGISVQKMSGTKVDTSNCPSHNSTHFAVEFYDGGDFLERIQSQKELVITGGTLIAVLEAVLFLKRADCSWLKQRTLSLSAFFSNGNEISTCIYKCL